MSNIFKQLRLEHNHKIGMDEKELTQTDLAGEFDCARFHINKLEKGTINPSIHDYIYYHNKFNVTIEYLLGETSAKLPENLRVGKDLGINDNVANTLADIHELSKEEYDLTAVLHAFIGNGENTVSLMGIILDYLAKEQLYNNSSENDALILSSLLRYINLHVKPQLKDVVQKYIDGQALLDEYFFPTTGNAENNGAL